MQKREWEKPAPGSAERDCMRVKSARAVLQPRRLVQRKQSNMRWRLVLPQSSQIPTELQDSRSTNIKKANQQSYLFGRGKRAHVGSRIRKWDDERYLRKTRNKIEMCVINNSISINTKKKTRREVAHHNTRDWPGIKIHWPSRVVLCTRCVAMHGYLFIPLLSYLFPTQRERPRSLRRVCYICVWQRKTKVSRQTKAH